MNLISLKTIGRLLQVGGLAAGFTTLVLGILFAIAKPAQAGTVSTRTVRVFEPPPLIITATEAWSVTAAADDPISIQDLFSAAAVIKQRQNLISGTRAEFPKASEVAGASAALELLSSSPVFSSNQIPAITGTYSMDWGDVDRDGDLDLAIGSTQGTAVYRNDGDFQFTPILSNSNYALEVRWANVDGDPNLELIAVGNSDSVNNSPLAAGINYVYEDPEALLPTSPVAFTSTVQIYHVIPGDFDNNNGIDLVVSTSALSPPDSCPVYLYSNMGSSPYFAFTNTNNTCVSNEATASLSAADFNNDGELDLALGRYQLQEFGVITNSGGMLSTTNMITAESGLAFPPFDSAWGDYNRDGYLDLAAVYPFQQETRIYTNTKGTGFDLYKSLPGDLAQIPWALDWADFNQDGNLDLAVAELSPKIYDGASDFNTTLASLEASADAVPITAFIRSLRGIDADNDADLDLALTNQFGPNLMFETTAPFISPKLTEISSHSAQSVAWGDSNNDGYLDLLFGSKLYVYSETLGVFTRETSIDLGATTAAFGKVFTTGTSLGSPGLDILLGANNNKYKIYKNDNNSGYTLSEDWEYPSNLIRSLAFGYLNNDEHLDVLLGNDDGQSTVAMPGLYTSSLPAPMPSWSSTDTGQETTTYDLAWADFDGDNYLDFAAANGGNKVVLYHNNIVNAFGLSQTLTSASDARGVAWADYDSDGDMDLAVGNYGGQTQVYTNDNGSLTLAWWSNEINPTTSVAWGDWDNDGDFDLAVGNKGQPDQVYANLGTLEVPDLQLLWESQESYTTTAVAWGDKDGDGDLDLAVSRSSGGQNGVYENHLIWPAQLNSNSFTQTLLPYNASYVSVSRPGAVPDSYFYSSPELQGYQADPSVVSITFKLFDPDGPRDGDPTDAGDNVYTTTYEYSLDGGGTWITATGQPLDYDGTTERSGKEFTFRWNAGANNDAFSDNARVRVSIIFNKPVGPVQRASYHAVSPPFRVRADNCNWPASTSIRIMDTSVFLPGNFVQFLGLLEPGTGSGNLSFTWNFGDGTDEVTAQFVNHRFSAAGTYPVTLKVKGSDCPKAQTVGANVSVIIAPATSGTGFYLDLLNTVYLPLILKSGTGNTPSPVSDSGLRQVTGLHGEVLSGQAGTRLSWSPHTDGDAVLGYRIYRASSAVTNPTFQLIETVSSNIYEYTDQTAWCGQMYFVTAFSAKGETEASRTSYFSPSCQ